MKAIAKATVRAALNVDAVVVSPPDVKSNGHCNGLAPDTVASMAFLRTLRRAGPWVLTAIIPDGPTETRTFDASNEEDARRFIESNNTTKNIYFTGNLCGRPNKKPTKADMVGAIFLHTDDDPRKDETPAAAKTRIKAAYDAHEPPPSIVIDSGNGLQGLWLLDADYCFDNGHLIADIELRNKALAAALGTTPGTCNVDRLLRLPGTINHPNGAKLKKGRVACMAGVIHATDAHYKLTSFATAAADTPTAAADGDEEIIPPLLQSLLSVADPGAGYPAGGYTTRSELLFAFLTGTLRAGVAHEAIAAACLDSAHSGCALYEHCIENGGRAYLERQINRAIKAVAQSGDAYYDLDEASAQSGAPSAQSEAPAASPLSAPDWPDLDPEAYYGLAGEAVACLAPHTEADPAALLVQYLVYFGNCIGRGPHMLLDGTKHYTNLFTVIAGKTSKARKGTAADRVWPIFKAVDSDWALDHVVKGVSSGEGLIDAVHDKVMEFDKKSGQMRLALPAIADKRLLLDEREFRQAIAVQKREGNTLSVVLRDAWDGREAMQTLTKNSRRKATNAMISCIGQITLDELRDKLDPAAMHNGLVNRFLFVCARRSKLLPRGGSADISAVVAKTIEAVSVAHNIGCMEWTERCGIMWDELYATKLSVDRPGILGAITARSEPQTARLAMVYALLDGSAYVRCRHLKAALALWDYCAASAHYIFGDTTGDPLADAVLIALRKAGASGLSRTDISGLFGRHTDKYKIEAALEKLVGKVRCERRQAGPKGGRPMEMWFISEEES